MMKKKTQILFALVVMVVITVVLGLVKFVQIRQAIAEHANFKMPPESVTTTDVVEVMWPDRWETIGSLAAVQGAELAAEEAGRVASIFVDSGSKVEKGQMLIALDTSVEEANLKGALARLELAKQNLSRATTLKNQSAMSIATLQDADSKLRQAEADVGSLKAVIDRKRILAPFAGRVGIRTVNIGQYVAQGAKMLPLFAVDPIHVDFSVPQNIAGKVTVGSKVTVVVDAVAEEAFKGVVSAINPNVDEATRNLVIQATVQNPKEQLRPGMFANITMEFGSQNRYIVVPSSGISYAPYGNSLFLVSKVKGEDGAEKIVAKNQIVRLGEKRGDLVAILGGLKVGDTVVTTGAFKLREGAELTIHNEKAPKVSEHPTVQDS